MEKTWQDRINECKTLLELLQLEKEFKDMNKDDKHNSEFYTDIYYDKYMLLSGLDDVYEQINTLQERLGKLEEDFKNHEHGASGDVMVKARRR